MPKQVQLRRGTTAEHSTFTGVVGEVTIDTTKDTVVVHDGTQVGGYPLARESALANYQPLDADLTAIGGLAGTSGFLKKTAANTWSLDTNTYITGNQSITLSGDASGSGTTAISVTLATQAGLSAGTYNNVTVNTKGIVTAASNVSYAGLASPTFTGTPAAPTASVDTNTTQLATTAFVLGQAGSANPVMNGTVSVGTSTRFARQDHVHPSDTTRAPLASPTFTGTVTTGTADLLGSVRQNVVAVAASDIDCSAGNVFTKTASGALTWTFSNVPASRAFTVILELTNGGTGTQTWPAAVKWPSGTAPTLTASGVDILGFITDDGGTNWRGVMLMKDSK